MERKHPDMKAARAVEEIVSRYKREPGGEQLTELNSFLENVFHFLVFFAEENDPKKEETLRSLRRTVGTFPNSRRNKSRDEESLKDIVEWVRSIRFDRLPYAFLMLELMREMLPIEASQNNKVPDFEAITTTVLDDTAEWIG